MSNAKDTTQTACERRRRRQKSTHQAFWRRQTGPLITVL